MKQKTAFIMEKKDIFHKELDSSCLIPSIKSSEKKEPIYDLDTIIKLSLELLKSLEPSQRKRLFEFGTEVAIRYFVIPHIEEKVKITEKAKEILLGDLELLVCVGRVVENLEHYIGTMFYFEKIDFDYDPEEPDWEIITISIEIKEKDYEKRFEIEDEIVGKAFLGIDIEFIKRIAITNIF